MRYAENKDRSAELLRLVLPLMARQNAAYHPVSYALWYEHLAGLNLPLSEILTSRLERNEPLSETDVFELHARFIVSRDMQRLELLQQKLRTLLEEAAQATLATSADTGRYGVLLEQSQARLSAVTALEGVQALVSELLTETARVQAATHAVTQKLEGKAQEVGLLSEQLQRAQSEALADPLTGLKNRRAFDRALADMLTAPETPEAGVAALLLIDIDHFKQVNDTHGHLVGDKVLRSIGATLASHIKGRDLAARLGGDEFAILLRQTTHSGAVSLAEQIRVSVANGKLHKADGSSLSGQVTVCVSIAIARRADSVESLMERADAGLYEAKQAGRNAVYRAPS